MSRPGLRILSLDGGGTRCLCTLYMLREIMGKVLGITGGKARPCEYFDLIGGSGLNALCAILFVRFCFTVEEALEFVRPLVSEIDRVEDYRTKFIRGEMSTAGWERLMNKSKDPVQQVMALRQRFVQDSWQSIIEQSISDQLERRPFTDNGVFDFRAPGAETEPGRCKAVAFSSESPGIGPNNGISSLRTYHVPVLHRTYTSRHGGTDYTLFAIGLAASACPLAIAPGVIFPELTASGEHAPGNPTMHLVEEARKLWPGLRVGTIISLGVGNFDYANKSISQLVQPAADASYKLFNSNKTEHDQIKRYIVPYDPDIGSAYFRFDTEKVLPFAETSEGLRVMSEVKLSFQASPEADECARAAAAISRDDFPCRAENYVALSSLASCLHALIIGSYKYEAQVLADVIANFMLYESASKNDETLRKVQIAADIEHLASTVRFTRHQYQSHGQAQGMNLQSEAETLNFHVAYNGLDHDDAPLRDGLQSLSDYAAAAHYFLVATAQAEGPQLQSVRFRSVRSYLAVELGIESSDSELLKPRASLLLKFSTLAALCQAGTIQVLKGAKGILHNGTFTRHLYRAVMNDDLDAIGGNILAPIANAFAILLRTSSWSFFRDDAILKLLLLTSTSPTVQWSFVNLAIERIRAQAELTTDRKLSGAILETCYKLLNKNSEVFDFDRQDVAVLSVKSGYFGLLRKCLKNEQLTIPEPVSDTTYTGGASKFLKDTRDQENGDTLLHISARLGFPSIMKHIIEFGSFPSCQEIVDAGNSFGQTPLHLACMNRAPKEVFAFLWLLGADRNIKCTFGKTPLHYCFPDQNVLPSATAYLEDMLMAHALPTTVPLTLPKAYGFYHQQGREVDSRVADFREIITELTIREADFAIPDQNGLTPVHMAAKEGWGHNIDLFMTLTGPFMDQRQYRCLTLKDADGLTVLDHCRITGVNGALDGGEYIVVPEMERRQMPIPPNHAEPVKRNEHTQQSEHKEHTERTELAIPNQQSEHNEPSPPLPLPELSSMPSVVEKTPKSRGVHELHASSTMSLSERMSSVEISPAAQPSPGLRSLSSSHSLPFRASDGQQSHQKVHPEKVSSPTSGISYPSPHHSSPQSPPSHQSQLQLSSRHHSPQPSQDLYSQVHPQQYSQSFHIYPDVGSVVNSDQVPTNLVSSSGDNDSFSVVNDYSAHNDYFHVTSNQPPEKLYADTGSSMGPYAASQMSITSEPKPKKSRNVLKKLKR